MVIDSEMEEVPRAIRPVIQGKTKIQQQQPQPVGSPRLRKCS